MKLILLSIEFVISVALIFAILLHSAKGEGLAGIGGRAKMFNTQKDLESGLTKVTGVLVALFMIIAGILCVVF